MALAAFFLASIAAAAPSAAGEPALRPSGPAPPESFSGRSVLLLKNGRMVRGRISRNSGGYVVQLPQGRMVVPVSQVELQAKTADAVYKELRKLIPPKSSRHRLALAGWCTTNELYDQALREVRTVLKADPDDDAAKRMLKRIETIVNRKDEPQQTEKTIYERITAPEATALAGLSPEVAETYVAKVQPILMNGCAQAGCHGPRSKTAFRLSMVHLRSGGRRGLSERNLATALRYIDLKKPERSPLLTKPLGSHGRRGRTIFRGRAGKKQLAVLREWTRQIAAESNSATTTPSRPQRRSRQRSARRGKPVGYQLTPAMQAARARNRKPAVRKARRQPQSQPGDPFDPAEFNRKTADPNRRPGTSSRQGRNP